MFDYLFHNAAFPCPISSRAHPVTLMSFTFMNRTVRGNVNNHQVDAESPRMFEDNLWMPSLNMIYVTARYCCLFIWKYCIVSS